MDATSVPTFGPTDDALRDAMATHIRALIGPTCGRILLIQPLQISEENIDINTARQKRYYSFPPYGLGVVNSNLKQRGYTNVAMLDLNYDVLAMIQECSAEKLDCLTESDLTSVWHERLRGELNIRRPHIVGLSCMYTMTHEMMARTAAFIKAYDPNIIVVAGGVHVTNDPELVLREVPEIDILALYESDSSFCDMLDVASGRLDTQHLSQLAMRINGEETYLRTRQTPGSNLVDLPPDYIDLPIDRLTDVGEIGIFRFWRAPGTRGGSAISNRGCRARCSFCSVRNFNGQGVRGRSVSAVVDEMECLRDRYGIGHITWLDDDLFFDEKRAVDLFEEMVRRNLGMTWDTSNGVLASSVALHPEMLDSAARSGCIAMCFGIESGSPEILKAVHKPSGIKHFLKVGEMMRAYPAIFTKGFLIIGFPNETVGQLRQTIQLANDMGLDWYSVQLLTPLPSTEIYKEMAAHGLIRKGTLSIGVRESERQKKKERTDGRNLFIFDEHKDDYVPSIEELNDIWFDVDFRVNYPKILSETEPARLEKIKYYLSDVSDRMTRGNALSNMFVGLALAKLGEIDAACQRRDAARHFLENSSYWQRRFTLQNLHGFLSDDVLWT